MSIDYSKLGDKAYLGHLPRVRGLDDNRRPFADEVANAAFEQDVFEAQRKAVEEAQAKEQAISDADLVDTSTAVRRRFEEMRSLVQARHMIDSPSQYSDGEVKAMGDILWGQSFPSVDALDYFRRKGESPRDHLKTILDMQDNFARIAKEKGAQEAAKYIADMFGDEETDAWAAMANAPFADRLSFVMGKMKDDPETERLTDSWKKMIDDYGFGEQDATEEEVAEYLKTLPPEEAKAFAAQRFRAANWQDDTYIEPIAELTKGVNARDVMRRYAELRRSDEFYRNGNGDAPIAANRAKQELAAYERYLDAPIKHIDADESVPANRRSLRSWIENEQKLASWVRDRRTVKAYDDKMNERMGKARALAMFRFLKPNEQDIVRVAMTTENFDAYRHNLTVLMGEDRAKTVMSVAGILRNDQHGAWEDFFGRVKESFASTGASASAWIRGAADKAFGFLNAVDCVRVSSYNPLTGRVWIDTDVGKRMDEYRESHKILGEQIARELQYRKVMEAWKPNRDDNWLEQGLKGLADSFALQGAAYAAGGMKLAGRLVKHPAAKTALSAGAYVAEAYGALQMIGSQFENMMLNGVDFDRALSLSAVGGYLDWQAEMMPIDTFLGLNLSPADSRMYGIRAMFTQAAKRPPNFMREWLRVNAKQAVFTTFTESIEELVQGINQAGMLKFAKSEWKDAPAAEIVKAYMSQEAIQEGLHSFIDALPTCSAFGLAGIGTGGLLNNNRDMALMSFADLTNDAVNRFAVENSMDTADSLQMLNARRVVRDRSAQVARATADMSPAQRRQKIAEIAQANGWSPSEAAYYAQAAAFYHQTLIREGKSFADWVVSGEINESALEASGIILDHDNDGNICGMTVGRQHFKVSVQHGQGVVGTDIADTRSYCVQYNRENGLTPSDAGYMTPEKIAAMTPAQRKQLGVVRGVTRNADKQKMKVVLTGDDGKTQVVDVPVEIAVTRAANADEMMGAKSLRGVASTTTLPHEYLHAFVMALAQGGMKNDGTVLTDEQRDVLDALARFGADEQAARRIETLFQRALSVYRPDVAELSLGNIFKNMMGSLARLITAGKYGFESLPAWETKQWNAQTAKAEAADENHRMRRIEDMIDEAIAPLLDLATQTAEERAKTEKNLDESEKTVADRMEDGAPEELRARRAAAQAEYDAAAKSGDTKRFRAARQALRAINRELKSGRYAPRFSMESDASDELRHVWNRYHTADGKPRKGWMKAPNGKPTNLTERQWLQVRTPAFKRWFGDWERAYYMSGWFDVREADEFVAMPSAELGLIQPIADKAEMKDVFRSFGDVRNADDGRVVRFPMEMAGRSVYFKNYANAFKVLFEGSKRAWSEKETQFEGHKSHPNIEAYHHYINKFRTDDGEYFVRFTVREGREGAVEGRDIVHAANVTDVEVYKNGTTQTDKLDRSEVPNLIQADKSARIDYKISNFLGRVNGASVSKVVDENGEPLVVTHSSEDDFWAFDASHDKAKNYDIPGFYFLDKRFGAYANRTFVKDCFLNLRNPLVAPVRTVVGKTADGHDRIRVDNTLSQYTATGHYAVNSDGDLKDVGRRDLIEDGYDGAIRYNEYIATDPAQIKSATDNVGTFDQTNQDTRYSMEDGLSKWDFAAEEAKFIANLNTAAAVDRNAIDIGRELAKFSTESDIGDYDNEFGTQVGEVAKFVDALHGGDREYVKHNARRFFKVAKTSDFLKGYGLTGDFVTIRTGVITKHDKKDAAHMTTPSTWLEIGKELSSGKPLAIVRYGNDDHSFRVYTNVKIGALPTVVGIDVKGIGKNIEVNAVSTVFGANAFNAKDEDIIYPEKKEEIQSLRANLNRSRYTESPHSADIVSNSAPSGQGGRFSMETEREVREMIHEFAKTKEAESLGWTPETVEEVIQETASLINTIHAAMSGDVNYDEWAKKTPTVKVDWRDGKEKPVVTWVRGNIEYKYDMSADTFCINNEGIESVLASPTMADLMIHTAQFAATNRNLKKEARGYASDDYLRLYETLRDMGFVVPCKGCFDAAMRIKMLPSVAQKFVDLVNRTIDERNANPKKFDDRIRMWGTDAQQKESKKGKRAKVVVSPQGFPLSASDKVDAVAIGVAGDKLTRHITWTQLMSAEGQTKALADWGGIFRAWQKTGAGRPKDKLMPEPWNGVMVSTVSTIIAPAGDKTPSFRDLEVNVGNGLRRNSHSEFRPVLAVDEIQFMREAFLKRLFVFKYMKELDDVRLFGKMGVKFNMSAFPTWIEGGVAAGLDADANYAWAEESVGGREFGYIGKDGKQHYDGAKGLEEAKRYVNEDCSLSAVCMSVPHMIKLMTDVPTPSNKNGTFGSLIGFHNSGATAESLKRQGLGDERAADSRHPFLMEAFVNYADGVTNFEQVQNDRFGAGWEVLEGKRKGSKVDVGHKIEFTNGTHYYNATKGIHLYSSCYTLDKEDNKVEHPFSVDYNDKVREIGGDYAYKAAADYYIKFLRGLGLVPRFDFSVPADKFVEMCNVAKVDPLNPKLGWKKGKAWSPCDSESYYALFCDYGMTDPETGKWSPHRAVGYKTASGELEFRLPDNAVEIITDGLNRYSDRKAGEDRKINDAIVEYCKRSIAAGKMSLADVTKILKRHNFSKDQLSALTADARFDLETEYNRQRRCAIRVNPNLRADLEAALVKRTSSDDSSRQLRRHDEVVFSDDFPFFEFLGLPNVRVVSDVVKIRKFAIKHHLTEEQISDLPNRYNSPVAVMKDNDGGFVALTDMKAVSDNGEEKPVRVYLRPRHWRSGEVVFVATAMAENAIDERKYYEPLMKSGLLFADENRIAGLGLEEETESILRTQASGDRVLTASDYSWWSTGDIIAHSGADVNGAHRFSMETDDDIANVLAHEIFSRGGKLPTNKRIDQVMRDNHILANRDAILADAVSIAQDALGTLAEISADPKLQQVIRDAGIEYRQQRVLNRVKRQSMAVQRERDKRERKLDKAYADQVRNASGLAYREMMMYYGINGDELLKAMPPKERPPAAKNEDGEEVTPVLKPVELTDADMMIVENAVSILVSRGKGLAEKANSDGAARERQEQKLTREMPETEDGEADDMDFDEDAAIGAEIESQIMRGIRESGISIDNPFAMVALIRELTKDYILRNPQTVSDLDASDVFASAIARSMFAANLSAFAQGVSRAYAPSYAQIRVARMCAELDSKNATTMRRIESVGESIFASLNDDVIRQSRQQLMKELHKGKRNDLNPDASWIGIDRLVKKHTVNMDEKDRRVSAYGGEYLKALKRVVDFSQEECGSRAEELEALCDAFSDVENKERFRDFQNAKLELQLIDAYGALRTKMPAQIMAAMDMIKQFVAEDLEALTKRQEQMENDRERLSVACEEGIVGNPKNRGVEPDHTKANGMLYSLCGMMEVRAKLLTTYCKNDNLREKSLSAFQEMEDIMFHCTTIEREYSKRWRDEMKAIVNRVFKNESEYAKLLDTAVDDETAKTLNRGDQNTLWRIGNVMQMYVSVVQDDYAKNCEDYGRTEGYALKLLDIIEKTDPRLLTMINEMRIIYAKMGDEISAVLKSNSGVPMNTPNLLYMPVAVRLDDKAKTGEARVFSAYAPALTPRRKHGLDFDQQADIMSVWMDRLAQTAHTVGWIEYAPLVQGVLQSKRVLKAIRQAHGKDAMTKWNDYVFTVLSGAKRNSVASLRNINWLPMMTSRLFMWGNISSNLNQLPAIITSSLSREMGGFRNLGKTLSMWALKPLEMWQIADDLTKTRAFVARYGSDLNMAVTNANRAGKYGVLQSKGQKVIDFGLAGLSLMDKAGILILSNTYRIERIRLEENGMSPQDASEKAAEKIMRIADKTAQGTTTMNASDIQQKGDVLHQMFLQFKTAPLQQFQFEYAAWQDWKNNPSDQKRAKALVEAVIVNHVLVPSVMAMVNAMLVCLRGGYDDPDEWRKMIAQTVGNMLVGSFGAIFIYGSLIDTAGSLVGNLITGQKVGNIDLAIGALPADTALKMAATVVKDICKSGSSLIDAYQGVSAQSIADAWWSMLQSVSELTWPGRQWKKATKRDSKKKATKHTDVMSIR